MSLKNKSIEELQELNTPAALKEIEKRKAAELAAEEEAKAKAEAEAEAELEAAKANPELSKDIRDVDPEAKYRLVLNRNKKVVYWTAEFALKKHNFKQLSERSQKILMTGKTATQIIKELEN